MGRKTGTFLVIFVLAIIALIISVNAFHHKKINRVLHSDEEILAEVRDAALHYKRVIKFTSDVEPKEAVMDTLFTSLVEEAPYIGGEFHHYTYTYRGPVDGKYYVKMNLSKPSYIASALSKIRAKQIAKHLNKKLTTDYEKVKAAHDYLVLLNKYSYIKGGAFACLYLRSSACNGYAYSFYEIMKELDIPVTCEFGANHAWNSVQVDGEWYNIDVTWDDTGSTASYDYFLIGQNDWIDHEHGHATAAASLEPKGRSASENYALIPNYKLFFDIALILAAAALVFGFRAFIRYLNQKELREIEEKLEREAAARRMFEEQIRKKQEEFSQENHNIW